MNKSKPQALYLTGFVLSIILTVFPFYIVICNNIHKNILITIIFLCAIIQIYVHLVCFLHLNNMSHQKWNLLSLIFTLFVIFILILGSIWIMLHLHQNLMI